MRVLYIKRIPRHSKRSLLRRYREDVLGWRGGPEGFFEAALSMAAKVTWVTLDEFMSREVRWRNSYDALIVNCKCIDWSIQPTELLEAVKKFSGFKVLFQQNDQPQDMQPNCDVDLFDLVFKREPWRDLGKYNLSPKNQDKIQPTHLPSPFAEHSVRFSFKNNTVRPRKSSSSVEKKYDVGFLASIGQGGKTTSRVEAWRRVVDTDLSTFGGLIELPGTNVPAELRANKLPRHDYIEEILKCRVNLALNGIGPFTFRHMELMHFGCFVLSGSGIKDLWFRKPLVDGRDFVTFSSDDEMVDLIQYYVDNPEKREAIGRSGQTSFFELNDCSAHSREIALALKGQRPIMLT